MSDIVLVDQVDQVNLREVAARVAARAEIRDVRLFKTEAALERVPQVGAALTYRLGTHAEVQYEPGDESFAVMVTYLLALAEADPELADAEALFAEDRLVGRVSFTLGSLFALNMRPDDEPPTESELEAYASTTGQFMLYPYAREYIYDVTGRLALPPLTVGVMRLDLPKPR